MNSPSVFLQFLIWITCAIFCKSFNPSDLLASGVQSLFSLQNPSGGSSIFSLLSNPLPVSRASKSDENTSKTLYGKPIADKSSVLESLFEINAKDYLTDGQLNSEPKVENPNREKENEIGLPSIFQDLDFLPLVKNDHRHKVVISPQDKPLLDYLESMRGEAWSHFKSILMTYVNSLDPPSSKGPKVKDSFPVKFMMKILDMGDKINIVHLLGKKVDPDVSRFLIETLKHSAPEILGLRNISEGDISAIMPTINKMINQFAWLSLRHIIDNLVVRVNSSFASGDLQKYISELDATNPFAAKGLRFVLSLPSQVPPYDPIGEGRSFGKDRTYRLSSRDGYSYHDDGYGHHDDGYGHQDDSYGYQDDHGGGYSHKDLGHGHKDVGYGDFGSHDGGSHGHGGYHKGIQLDPYLILAGIGTAALLAFVAFRILTTMRKRRSVDDPDLISMVLTSIEEGQQLYEYDFMDEAEDLIDSINDLWTQTSSGSCAKCSLFDSLRQRINSHDSLKMILLSGFGKMLGAGKAGQLLDEMTERHLTGKANELR